MSAIPATITAYFAAKNVANSSELIEFFSAEPDVTDNDDHFAGRDAVRGWLDTSVAGLHLSNEIVGHTHEDGVDHVSVVTSGDFDGSPVDFDFAFTLVGEAIDVLRITFKGLHR